MPKQSILVFFWLALAVVVSTSRSAQCAAPKDVWKLEMNTYGGGPCTVLLSRDAVKILQPSGFKLLARAPKWDCYCYGKNKNIWIQPLKKFCVMQLVNPTDPFDWDDFVRSHPLRYQSKSTKLGFKASKYRDAGDFTGEGYGLLVADDIPITREAAEVLNRFFNTPKVDKLLLARWTAPHNGESRKVTGGAADWHPTAIDYQEDHARLIMSVDTKSIARIPYKESDFAYPTGLTVVKRASDATISDAQRSEIKNMLEDIGFSPDLKSKPRK